MKIPRLSSPLTVLTLTGVAILSLLVPGSAPAEPGCFDSSPVTLTYRYGTTPFTSRAQLDARERQIALAEIPPLASIDLPPQTKLDADMIRQIREMPEYWETRCNRKVRRLEVVISKSAIDIVNSNQSFFGTNIQEYLRAHVAWMNKMVLESQGEFDTFWELDRVMVVSNNVVQGEQPHQCHTPVSHGWQVCNDKSYSWWANDRLNGVTGDIPYDIDSRWVLTDDWAESIMNSSTWPKRRMDPLTGKRLMMDFALIHELFHHVCMGDIYHYEPGDFRVPIPNGRYLKFRETEENENSNFARETSASNLTLIDERARQYCIDHNPKLKRAWQDTVGFLNSSDSTLPAEGYVEPYGASLSSPKIRVNYHGWSGNVEGCYFGKGLDQVVQSPSAYASHSSTSCSVYLWGDYMDHAWPVSYVVLKVNWGGTRFELPIVIQRLLFNDLAWSNDPDGWLQISLTNHFGYVLGQLRNKILSTGNTVVNINEPYQVLVEQREEVRLMTDSLKVFAQAQLHGSSSDAIWGLPFQSNPQKEICDGRDNDDDGGIDESDVCDCRTYGPYEICEERVEWEEARTACKAKGKEMLVIDSGTDRYYFRDRHQHFLTHWNYWVGLTDQLNEGQWRELDGSAATYNYWAPGEPNGGTNESCAVLTGSITWNDLSCQWENSFICE